MADPRGDYPMTTHQHLSEASLLRLPQIVGDKKRGIPPLVLCRGPHGGQASRTVVSLNLFASVSGVSPGGPGTLRRLSSGCNRGRDHGHKKAKPR